MNAMFSPGVLRLQAHYELHMQMKMLSRAQQHQQREKQLVDFEGFCCFGNQPALEIIG